MCDPLSSPPGGRRIGHRGVTLFALELLPRITRAQSMDVLSSQATMAGYRAVLMAAATMAKMFPMMMTAAGTIPPAKVFVVGAGVAGFRPSPPPRLGGVVSAYDVRPAVKEQVQSLGAKFVEMPLETAAAETKGGYAQADGRGVLSQAAAVDGPRGGRERHGDHHGRGAGQEGPVLVTTAMVDRHGAGFGAGRPGGRARRQLRIDAAGQERRPQRSPHSRPARIARRGALSRQPVICEEHCDVPAVAGREGKLQFDMEDEIVRETLVARDGQVVQPSVAVLLAK